MISKRVHTLLRRTPIIDGHNDLPWALRQRFGPDVAFAPAGEKTDRENTDRENTDRERTDRERTDRVTAVDVDEDLAACELHTDTGRLISGVVGAQFWSVYVPCSITGAAAVSATLHQIDLVRRMVARSDRLALAGTAAEVEQVRAEGLIASLMGVEGGHSIDGSLAVLRMYYELGARYLTLTHNLNTPWADSATDAPVLGGLSDFGRDVVRECNRLGMMADLSHTSPATMHATLDVSTAPAFFSHSSARALCDHPRNVPDDVLTRVRDSNGMVMVTFVPGFLTEPCRAWFGELTAAEVDFSRRWSEDSAQWLAEQRRWIAEHPPPHTGVRDVADHIEHVREVAGVDHVGLGGDFDGVCVLPEGLGGVDTYPALLQELTSRGWSDTDLGKLTWHNGLRVLRDTEVAARDVRRPG